MRQEPNRKLSYNPCFRLEWRGMDESQFRAGSGVYWPAAVRCGLGANRAGFKLLASLVGVASWFGVTDARGERSSAASARSEFEYDGDFLRNLSGGIQQGNAYNGYIKFGETLGFGSWLDPADESSGRREYALHASLIFPHGESLSREDVGDLNGVSNYYSNSGLRLFSLWAEGNFFSDQLSLRMGIWALDKGSGFWQSEGAGHFLNSGFGTFPVISYGLVAPIYPVSAPCIRVEWKPVEAQPLTLRTAIFSGDVGTPADNRHNTQWNLSDSHGVSLFAEAEYKAKSSDGSTMGTYKVGGFYDSQEFTDMSGAQPHHGNYGCYVVADQNVSSIITCAPHELAVFAKFAVAPEDRNFVTFDTEAGISYTGLFATADGREDVLALGVGHSMISGRARDASGNEYPKHGETVLELTYQAHLPIFERQGALNVLVQPDLQYIIHPGAVLATPNALVAGVRLTARF